jgi:hypothetical protein
MGQEVNREGWSIPDLRGLIPYSIQVKKANEVEKIVEKFFTPDGGHVARISGNGKIFAYAVDSNREPPIDYLLLDPDGLDWEDLHRSLDPRIPTRFLNGFLVDPSKASRLTPLIFLFPLNKKGHLISIQKV